MTDDSIKSAANGAVIVDKSYYWRPMHTAPIGAKLQLLNLGGVAVYGSVTEKTRGDWLGWAPLPRRHPNEG